MAQKKLPPNPKQAFGDKKPPLDEIPLIAEIEESLALLDGDGKYGFRNWRENPVEARTYVKAAKRHLMLWAEGQERTLDTNIHNLAAVKACCSILMDAQANGMLIDNRSKSQAAVDLMESAEDVVKGLQALRAAGLRDLRDLPKPKRKPYQRGELGSPEYRDHINKHGRERTKR